MNPKHAKLVSTVIAEVFRLLELHLEFVDPSLGTYIPIQNSQI